MKIVFFGSGWYTIPVIKKLIPLGLDVVVTTESSQASPFLKFCAENNIKTLFASTANDLINHKSLIINHSVAILASYGALVPDEIISIFPHGIINIHPSLLPKWKGPSPIQFSLLNGDTTTGVTLIKLDKELDHGPILSQKPYTLSGNETSEDLLSILFEIGAEMVEDIVLKLEKEEEVTETPQNHHDETWSYHIEKKDGEITLDSVPEKDKLNQMIRAYFPWPGVWLKWQMANGKWRIVKLLPEGRVHLDGGKPMSYKDFINGFGEQGRELLQKLNLA